MANVFNVTPGEFVDLNDFFPVLNEATGLTYEQFRILVENTFWLKNQEEIGVVKAFIVSGSSQFGSLWLSDTDGGSPLNPNAKYIYVIQSTGPFKGKIYEWNGTLYSEIAKDSDNNYTNDDKAKVDILTIDGDGTKYLNDKGEYETISGGGGVPSRIQNPTNTNFFDTSATETAINNTVSFSNSGGSEVGKFIHSRNNFELSAEKIHTNPNFKYAYKIASKNTGGININVQDTLNSNNQDYDFNLSGYDDNNVARMKDIKGFNVKNYTIQVSDWIADSTYASQGFNYVATISIIGITSDFEPSVTLAPSDSQSANYSNWCESIENGIKIWAKSLPIDTINIPLAKGVII